MESLSDELSNAFGRADVKLEAADTVTDLDLHSAPASLLLALRNLIKNAIDHSPLGSPIEISAEQRSDCVALGVRDQDLGISANELG